MNWPATLAAVRARGPRCETCNGWTFRPHLLADRALGRICQECEIAALRAEIRRVSALPMTLRSGPRPR